MSDDNDSGNVPPRADAGGSGGNGKQGSFAESIWESNRPSERIQKGAEFYFGNNR